MTTYRNRFRTQADLALGRYLATTRVDRGLTQTEVARRVSANTSARVTQVTISNIERGRTPCTVSQYLQLCRVYGIDPPGVPASVTKAAHTPCEILPDDTTPRLKVKS